MGLDFNKCGSCGINYVSPPTAGILGAEMVFSTGGHDGFFVATPPIFNAILANPALLLDEAEMTTYIADGQLRGLRSCDKLSVRFGDASANTKEVGNCGAKRTTHKTETVTIEYMGEDGQDLGIGVEFDFWNWLCANESCLMYGFFKCTEDRVYLYGKPSSVVATHKKGDTFTDENILRLTLEFLHTPCGGRDLQPAVPVGDFLTSDLMQNVT